MNLPAILKGHSNDVRSVAFNADGTSIVSGSRDNTVRVWDAITGTLIRTIEGHTNDVFAVAFSIDGTRIVSGSRDNTVRLDDKNFGFKILNRS